MSRMLKSSGAMGAATLTSRVLGMVREIVYARFMGDGWVAGAFTLAFMIPNLFRRLLGEGALTAAFIPLFKEKEKTAGESEMWRSANAVISGLVVAGALIVGLVLLGVSLALSAAEFDAGTRLMLELLRVMFPYMLLVCLAAVFMGMCNARGHFFIPAMGATMLNVVMIAAVLFLAPRMGATLEQQIFGLAIGVLVAGAAQAAFQLPTLRREGFRCRWERPWGNATVRTVVERMVPGTIGVAALQINVLLTQGIAFGVEPSIVASFNYAVRLMELPQGVFGVSLATFLLPTLSGLAAEKKHDEFKATVDKGLEHLLFFNLPVSIWLVVLAEPIVRLLFQRGEFSAESTARTTFALQCMAPGLVAFSGVNILARAFFALGDTKTPMKISIICLLVNLALVVALVGPMRQGGLGLANTLSGWLNVALLLVALRGKAGGIEWRELKRALGPVVVCAATAGAVAWGVAAWWTRRLGHETTGLKIGEVLAPLMLAGGIYWLATWLARVPTAREVTGLLGARPGRGVST